MYEFPHVRSHEKLADIFSTLVEKEVPDKFTYRFLSQIGYASSNDRDIVPALRLLGLIDEKSKPTDFYYSLRDPETFNSTMAAVIESAYSQLFSSYADAASVSESVLTGYFSKLTGESQSSCTLYTRTFLELVRISGYDADTQEKNEEALVPTVTREKSKTVVPNLNLSINLPTTTDERVYETLFKHLRELLDHQ